MIELVLLSWVITSTSFPLSVRRWVDMNFQSLRRGYTVTVHPNCISPCTFDSLSLAPRNYMLNALICNLGSQIWDISFPSKRVLIFRNAIDGHKEIQTANHQHTISYSSKALHLIMNGSFPRHLL